MAAGPGEPDEGNYLVEANDLGTPEKARSTAAQLVSAIETR